MSDQGFRCPEKVDHYTEHEVVHLIGRLVVRFQPTFNPLTHPLSSPHHPNPFEGKNPEVPS
jgi:hypothetical protein